MMYHYFVSLILLATCVNAWSFYDYSKFPLVPFNLSAAAISAKQTLFTSKGAYMGVQLGGLSYIDAKLVVVRTNENSHIHNNDLLGVVFEASGTMNTPDRALFFGAGDTFVVPAGTMHFSVNSRNATLDTTVDSKQDYIVLLSSFAPQPFTRVPLDTSLQHVAPPTGLSKTFRSGVFRSIRGASNDVNTGSVTSSVPIDLLSTANSSAIFRKINAYRPITLNNPFDAIYVVLEGRALVNINQTTKVLEQKDIFAVPKNTKGILTPLTSLRLIFQTGAPTASDVAVCQNTLRFVQTTHSFGSGRIQVTVTLQVGEYPLYNAQIELTSANNIYAIILLEKVPGYASVYAFPDIYYQSGVIPAFSSYVTFSYIVDGNAPATVALYNDACSPATLI